MKKKRLGPIGVSENFKTIVVFIAMLFAIFAMLFLGAIISGCTSQNVSAAEKSQEELIFELKCKLESKEKLVRAYENVLHEVWLDKPNYVEDALSETDAFYDLNEIMGDTDVFRLRNATDSARYKYEWFHETDD